DEDIELIRTTIRFNEFRKRLEGIRTRRLRGVRLEQRKSGVSLLVDDAHLHTAQMVVVQDVCEIELLLGLKVNVGRPLFLPQTGGNRNQKRRTLSRNRVSG